MNKLGLSFIILISGLCLFACKQKPIQNKIITVTIEPQRYFAEQLCDTFFQINVMVPAGTSPETYDPSPSQMTQLAESEAYFKIGHIGFEEAWMGKIQANNPNLKIYDNSKGISFITSADHVHDEGEHAHVHAGGIDPHIWNSPKEALMIAGNMCDAFIELDPDNRILYQNNLSKLEKQIQQTDSTVAGLLNNSPNKSFIIYHPALTYFANYYGLAQYCIETDGKEPSPEQIKSLVEMTKSKGVKIIFIQQEFDQKNAEIISQETGSRIVVINPLSYDWNGEIIKIAKALSNE